MELFYSRLESFRPSVVVKRNDVGLRELDHYSIALSFGIAPRAMPEAAGERLRWIGRSGPCKGEWQQMIYMLDLVGILVGRECTHNAFYIGTKLSFVRRV